jgi:type IV pilus assembly protein PilB
MHITDGKLKKILQDSGLVDDATFTMAKNEAFRSGQNILDILIGRGSIPEHYLGELLQPYFRSPIINLEKTNFSQDTLEKISETYAKSKNVVLFEYDKEKNIGKVAMLDPLDFDTIEFLRAKLGVWVEAYWTTPASLKYALKFYKKKIAQEFSQIITENIEKSISVAGQPDVAKMAEAVPIITILDSIIEHAIALGASDIHFEPLTKEFLIRFRVDGIMQEILSMPKVIAPILVARVKVLARLLIDENRVPQDGRFHFEMDSGIADVRVNIMPVFHGEKVEMRILRSANKPLSLEDLGLPAKGIAIIKEEIKKTHGLILVTGPTGHGKTTTLYAMMYLLNTPEVNIATIEDPIEYEISRVNQTQVNQKAGITFANGLRSLMRQNPDIIMIGEIRDNETVDIAVHAALTGHLVLSSLHTNDAPSALPRLLDMGAPAFLLSSTVNVVVAQRLVRHICTSCIESYVLSPEEKRLLMAQASASAEDQVKANSIPSRVFRGKGCKVCGNSGFRGQVGIFEVLRVTEGVRKLVLDQAPTNNIKKLAIKEGMQTMFQDGLKKVEKGITTIEEVLRVIRE